MKLKCRRHRERNKKQSYAFKSRDIYYQILITPF